jgi:hypothetical protein
LRRITLALRRPLLLWGVARDLWPAFVGASWLLDTSLACAGRDPLRVTPSGGRRREPSVADAASTPHVGGFTLILRVVHRAQTIFSGARRLPDVVSTVKPSSGLSSLKCESEGDGDGDRERLVLEPSADRAATLGESWIGCTVLRSCSQEDTR